MRCLECLKVAVPCGKVRVRARVSLWRSAWAAVCSCVQLFHSFVGQGLRCGPGHCTTEQVGYSLSLRCIFGATGPAECARDALCLPRSSPAEGCSASRTPNSPCPAKPRAPASAFHAGGCRRGSGWVLRGGCSPAARCAQHGVRGDTHRPAAPHGHCCPGRCPAAPLNPFRRSAPRASAAAARGRPARPGPARVSRSAARGGAGTAEGEAAAGPRCRRCPRCEAQPRGSTCRPPPWGRRAAPAGAAGPGRAGRRSWAGRAGMAARWDESDRVLRADRHRGALQGRAAPRAGPDPAGAAALPQGPGEGEGRPGRARSRAGVRGGGGEGPGPARGAAGLEGTEGLVGPAAAGATVPVPLPQCPCQVLCVSSWCRRAGSVSRSAAQPAWLVLLYVLTNKLETDKIVTISEFHSSLCFVASAAQWGAICMGTWFPLHERSS